MNGEDSTVALPTGNLHNAQGSQGGQGPKHIAHKAVTLPCSIALSTSRSLMQATCEHDSVCAALNFTSQATIVLTVIQVIKLPCVCGLMTGKLLGKPCCALPNQQKRFCSQGMGAWSWLSRHMSAGHQSVARQRLTTSMHTSLNCIWMNE